MSKVEPLAIKSPDELGDEVCEYCIFDKDSCDKSYCESAYYEYEDEAGPHYGECALCRRDIRLTHKYTSNEGKESFLCDNCTGMIGMKGAGR